MAILQNRSIKRNPAAAYEAAAPLVPATNASKPKATGSPVGAQAFGGPKPGPPNNPLNPQGGGSSASASGVTTPNLNKGFAGRGTTLVAPVAHGNTAPPAESQGSYVDQNQSDQDAEVVVSNEEMYNQAMRDLIGNGPRDTKEEERLLREQMQRDVGSGQANLNARMAAGGMGTSGALSALGTDMRSKAAFDAANSIQGVRSDARDEWSRNVQGGLGLMNQDRNLDMNEAKYQQYLDMMDEMFGEKEKTPEERKASISDDKFFNNAGTGPDSNDALEGAGWKLEGTKRGTKNPDEIYEIWIKDGRRKVRQINLDDYE